ncbi:MAG: efflux RND transporter permease subunit [Parvibaculum sp.]|nr:efflux RND transporter permease subunit [Parvibaculum sp.]
MNIAQWAASHRYSILFLLLVAAIGGIANGFSLPVALFPQVSFPRISVSVDAGDRPASQMVAEVTRPIESAVKSVPGLLETRSTSSRGNAELSLNFAWGENMATRTLQVQSAISRILPTLPSGTAFEVRRMDPTVFPVAAYSLTSKSVSPVHLREIAQYQLLPILSSINGVANVNVMGGDVPEIRIDVDAGQLAAYALTMDDVSKSLAAANVLQVTGRVEDRHKLLFALTDTKLTNLDDIRSVVVRSSPMGNVRLSDVAKILRATAPNWTIIQANGKPAVLFQIFQQPGGNTVQIINDVTAALASYEPKLPPSVKVSNWYNQSDLIIESAKTVFDAIMIGIGLAAVVLFLFLRNLKVTIITLVVVPAVLSATVLLLYALGMSFNIMTLGGMAAAIGLIIDDAIVMIEQIVRHLGGSEKTLHEKIRRAAREFWKPLLGSSSATVVIFVPLAFLSGVTGAFFKALSLTMASSLIVSFFVAFFVIPLLADVLISEKDADIEHEGRVFARITSGYRRAFTHLQVKPLLLVAGMFVLMAGGYFSYRNVGSGFMPIMDEGGFILDYIAPPGTSLPDMKMLLGKVEKVLNETPEVATYSLRAGAQLGGGLTETNTGDLFVKLKSLPRRPIDEITAEVRRKVADQVPGLDIDTAQLMEDMIGDLTSVPQPIEIKIFGDDEDQLRNIAPQVAKAIESVQGVTEIRDGVVIAGDALSIKIDRVKAGLEGLTPDQINQQVNAYLSGTVATKIQRGDRTIDLRVWVPEAQRSTPENIRQLRIIAPDGHKVALGRVASIDLETGQPQITRDNLKPMVAVTARIEGRDLGSTVADVKALLDQSNLFPPGSYYQLGGLYEQQQTAFQGLIRVIVAAFALVFLLLLFLYERVSLAVSIIAMPLAAMSAVFVGLWITGIELNITAMMGMTMVVGIVTEIAIFYFSEYEALIASGVEKEDALLKAGLNRLRPIAMTTLAAILALMPLALGLGQGAAMQQPLAIAIISGLIVQIPLVLLAMPIAFSALEELSERLINR